MTLDWQLGSGVHDQNPGTPLALVLTNHTDESLTGHATLRLRGLGASRLVELGTATVVAHGSTTFSWSPVVSPIQPVWTSATITPYIAFSRADASPNLPGASLALAFSTDTKHAFVSVDDDSGVRLASLGRRGAGAVKSVTDADKAALLAQLGSHRGTVDGVAINQTAVDAASSTALSASPPSSVSDSIAYQGAISESALNLGVQPNFSVCLAVNLVTGPICADYQVTSFTDVDVYSPNVPLEDHDFVGTTASYTNASVVSAGSTIWQGRLDANGCTPSIRYCRYKTQVNVSTASVQVPQQYINGALQFASRDIEITPAETYSSSMRYGSNGQTGAPLAWADLYDVAGAADYPLRVAAVMSRIVTMPDSGLLFSHIGYTAPTLNIHTENGCSSYPYDAGTGSTTYGEACADANGNGVYFGQALSYADPNNPQPTGHHTTEEAFTIAHETGHAMQFAAGGGPTSANYADIPTDGLCSCYYVAVGDRTHCMESRLNEPASEIEGFAHFFATRVMNDQDSTSTGARFTYYKEFNQVTYTGPTYGDAVLLIHPPVPINAGAPFSDNGTTGWTRHECPESAHASEYDFLTFLWAVNGNAPTGSRGSMQNLFSILGNPTVVANFSWSNIVAQATTTFGGATTAKALQFSQAGAISGVNQ